MQINGTITYISPWIRLARESTCQTRETFDIFSGEEGVLSRIHAEARRKLFDHSDLRVQGRRGQAVRSARKAPHSGREIKRPVLDPQSRKALRMSAVQIAMVLQHACLGRVRPSGQTLEVVVPVALDVLDTQGSHHGQILKQGDGTDVGQILSGEMNGAFSVLPLAGKTGGIGNPLDDTLAIFVAHPVITQGKGLGKGIDGAVSLIDNEGRTIRPIRELGGDVRGKGLVPVGGLLDQQKAGIKEGEFFRSPAKFPSAS